MCNASAHGAYYRAQTLANLSFLFPLLPPLSLITAAGTLYLVSTDPHTHTQTILHERHYTRHLVPSEKAVLHLYSRSSKLVQQKIRLMKDGKRRQLEMFLTTDVGVVDEVLGGKGWTDKVGLGGYEYGHTDHNRGLGEHFRGDIDAGALRMDMNVVRERRKERERPRVPLEGVETPGVGKKMEVVDGPLLKWNLGQAADVASSVPMPQSAAGENRV